MGPVTPRAPQAKALPTIITDTAEQQPWLFPPDVAHSVRASLIWGDYSLLGYETVISAERKSLPDLVNTTIHDLPRFKRECEGLSTYRQKLIVVEGGISDLYDPQAAWRKHSSANPSSVHAITISITSRYGIPVLWAGDRIYARLHVERWLVYHWVRRGELLEPASPAQEPAQR